MRKLALLVGAAALAVGVVATVALADHVGDLGAPAADDREFFAGNPSCSDIDGFIVGPKVDPGANDTFANAVTITNYNGTTFDWALTDAVKFTVYDMAAVIVKGGPNAAVYWYDWEGPNFEDDSDTGLHAPVNHNNGKYYGISHIQFCFDPKGPPPA